MSNWLYEVLLSALVLILVLDPLRLLQIEVAAGQPEKTKKRHVSRPGTTFLAALGIVLFTAVVPWVLRIGRDEMRLVSAGLLGIMQLRYMLSETVRNRELPAARYVAELHPQMLCSSAVLAALVFTVSWYGTAANCFALLLAGMAMRMARLTKPARRVPRVLQYYSGLSWLEQLCVLLLAVQSAILALRILAR